MHIIEFIKSRIRQHRLAESVLFFLYSRIMYCRDWLQAQYYTFFINAVRHLVIKSDIAGIEIQKSETVLVLRDRRKFYWNSSDRTSLIGLGLSGEWETDEVEFMHKVIKKGDTVIDIGANYGFYTTLFSTLVGARGSVHSFEPLSGMYTVLQRHVTLNALPDNIRLNRMGLAEKTGNAKIYIPEDMGPSAATLKPRGFVNREAREEVIKLTTLDAYVQSNSISHVHFIKCDVEGAELLALKGAEKTLRKYTPVVMVEITRSGAEAFGYTPETLFDYLNTCGYTQYFSIENGRLRKLQSNSIPYFHGNCFAVSRSFKNFTALSAGGGNTRSV